MDEPKKRRFQFGLRTLFVATAVSAIFALAGPLAMNWFFPPRFPRGGETLMNDHEFRELMRRIEQTAHQPADGGDDIVIILGPGQSVHE